MQKDSRAKEEKWINSCYSHRRVKRNVLDRKRARNGNVTGVINLTSRANSDTMIRATGGEAYSDLNISPLKYFRPICIGVARSARFYTPVSCSVNT